MCRGTQFIFVLFEAVTKGSEMVYLAIYDGVSTEVAGAAVFSYLGPERCFIHQRENDGQWTDFSSELLANAVHQISIGHNSLNRSIWTIGDEMAAAFEKTETSWFAWACIQECLLAIRLAFGD